MTATDMKHQTLSLKRRDFRSCPAVVLLEDGKTDFSVSDQPAAATIGGGVFIGEASAEQAKCPDHRIDYATASVSEILKVLRAGGTICGLPVHSGC